MAEDTTAPAVSDNAVPKLSDDMTLEEKLQAIDQMMKQAQVEANHKSKSLGVEAAPVDPADLTMCLGCQ